MLIKVYIWSHRNLLVTFFMASHWPEYTYILLPICQGIMKGVLCFDYQRLTAGSTISYA